jgi:UDP:flavonoid glycosyltransferase YjiC (YdhE family)
LAPVLLTTAAHSPLDAIAEGFACIRLPSSQEQHFQPLPDLLTPLVQALQPQAWVVDTFPWGPQNELNPMFMTSSTPRLLVQRSPEIPVPAGVYQACCIPAPEDVGYVLVRQPQACLPRAQARAMLRAQGDRPLVLVAHNGDPAEGQALFELVARASVGAHWDLRLATQRPLAMARWADMRIHWYPLIELMPGADLVIGAGGYHLIAEAQCLGQRLLVCPQPRPFDDQYRRCQNIPQFLLTTPPEQLRLQIGHQLQAPAPRREERCQGAIEIARRLVKILG